MLNCLGEGKYNKLMKVRICTAYGVPYVLTLRAWSMHQSSPCACRVRQPCPCFDGAGFVMT